MMDSRRRPSIATRGEAGSAVKAIKASGPLVERVGWHFDREANAAACKATA